MAEYPIAELVNFALHNIEWIIAAILIFYVLGKLSGSTEEEGKNYTRAHLVNASPRKFEELVAQAYEQNGYETKVLPEGPDDGVDVIAEKRRETIAIQAKRFQVENKVGAPTVRRVAGAAQQHGTDRAVIATSSDFTEPAEEAAEALDVDLIDGQTLATELSR